MAGINSVLSEVASEPLIGSCYFRVYIIVARGGTVIADASPMCALLRTSAGTFALKVVHLLERLMRKRQWYGQLRQRVDSG